MNILVTGATGFIGNAVANHFSRTANANIAVTAAVRDGSYHWPRNISKCIIGNIDSKTNWESALRNIDVIVHCAALAAVSQKDKTKSHEDLREVNVLGTINLAKQAEKYKVRRLIYLSSIKVNGEASGRTAFTEEDQAHPEDAYAQSKHESEQALLALSKNTNMDVFIIRPPMVYGPGVKANFLMLMKGVAKGIPLPLGGIDNKRSLISIDNLIDFITLCTDHPNASNEIFLVSDNNDLSTTELLREIAKAMGKKSRLVSFPPILLILLAKLVGKKSIADRLFSSLQLSCLKAQTELGWQPSKTVGTALLETTQAFFLEKRH